MTKKVLSLFIFLFSAVFMSSAQSSLSKSDGTPVISGNDTTLQHANVKIINTSSNPLDIKVYMNTLNANPNHITYFCWGIICYPNTITVSTDPVTINPGDTAASFIGYLNPNSVAAVSEVTYSFFDVNDNSDSIGFTVTFDMTVGINKLKNNVSLSDAYPNPANNLTRISYDINKTKNAKLVLYNILGSKIKSIELNDPNGSIILATSGLTSGIYYYSIEADGQIIPAKKLIVAHK